MLAGFARRSDCRLKERGRSRALGRSDTACRFVGRWITFRRTEGEPVHGELLICAHFLHFLESLSGCCHARFSKSEEGPRDRFGVSGGRTPRITGRPNCLDPRYMSNIRSVHPCKIHLDVGCLPASSQQLLNSTTLNLTVLNWCRQSEERVIQRIVMRNAFLIEFR